MITTQTQLAIHGGPKACPEPFPYRALFGEDELLQVQKVFHQSWDQQKDFSYQGPWEDKYTNAFCDLQGGGFADGVSSGTAAVLLAVLALNIPKGSEVIISPVTDPGGISPLLFLGLKPVIADAAPNGFNIGADEFESAITPNTRAALLTHTGGIPIDIEPIVQIAKKHSILLIEDASQAHGASIKGRRVGTFGDIAAFSTMFSKLHATGGCGGVVFTQNQELYHQVRMRADRGKAPWDPKYQPKDPATFTIPGLNLNMDELSAAIGYSTLRRLPQILERRLELSRILSHSLNEITEVKISESPAESMPAPFFLTLELDLDRLSGTKQEVTDALIAEGVPINPDYRYIASDWPWLRPYLAREAHTPNAQTFRSLSFNLLYHERFQPSHMKQIASGITKVIEVYR